MSDQRQERPSTDKPPTASPALNVFRPTLPHVASPASSQSPSHDPPSSSHMFSTSRGPITSQSLGFIAQHHPISLSSFCNPFLPAYFSPHLLDPYSASLLAGIWTHPPNAHSMPVTLHPGAFGPASAGVFPPALGQVSLPFPASNNAVTPSNVPWPEMGGGLVTVPPHPQNPLSPPLGAGRSENLLAPTHATASTSKVRHQIYPFTLSPSFWRWKTIKSAFYPKQLRPWMHADAGLLVLRCLVGRAKWSFAALVKV